MPALAATDLIVVVTNRSWHGNRKQNSGTMLFGDGVLTYPTGGILLPDKAKFGFQRVMDWLDIIGLDLRTSDFVYSFNLAEKRLYLFGGTGTAGPLPEIANTFAPTVRTLGWTAMGW